MPDCEDKETSDCREETKVELTASPHTGSPNGEIQPDWDNITSGPGALPVASISGLVASLSTGKCLGINLSEVLSSTT